MAVSGVGKISIAVCVCVDGVGEWRFLHALLDAFPPGSGDREGEVGAESLSIGDGSNSDGAGTEAVGPVSAAGAGEDAG